jgi:UDP-N-acetylglucosamine--N-acetylmuramyl-(pentapeptide) pyrophosphoryl-undecaprenol N-acetylglucosamine transferase
VTRLRTILFAGGGTGGHIFPNLAVLDVLLDRQAPVYPHFVVSNRALDAQIMKKHPHDFTALPAVGLQLTRPWTWLEFRRKQQASTAVAADLIRAHQVSAVIATGGFVSAPVVLAAEALNVPCAVVNLDAVPGKANRRMAPHATEVFTCYPHAALRHARRIGMPIRRCTIATQTPQACRTQLGLDANRPTLLITAGSQGATTINQMMIELVSRTKGKHELSAWQVLHLSGHAERDAVAKAYQDAGVPARVEAFCNAMGLAWGAATVALSRAGAGSVAEVHANAVPTHFFPYPFHKDQHQRLNAAPLVDSGAALLLTDLVDPIRNVNQMMGHLVALMNNTAQREKMIATLKETLPEDGATVIATWLRAAAGITFG